ncbi:phytoene/squalene synthase family protein [Bhargavaea ullalensis]|uniref:Phytoene synthase n=1 Tax=Bhargavaea ullalensis TaxID=1265685 RepID=A0ABV2G7W6_9BACL
MTPAQDRRLQHDYLYCETIIKRHSKSFYYAFSRLPKEKAQAVYAIYSFCRMADDIVDREGSRARKMASLKKLEEELNLFECGQEPDTSLWRALRDVFNRFPMDIGPFRDQIAGQRMDLHFRQPSTLPELEKYSYFVAGSVGLALLPIIASQTDSADIRQQAVDLGVAMQLTNILRDIGEDYRQNNRVYLPAANMKRHSFSMKMLGAGSVNPAFISLWEEIAGRAETLYDRFEQQITGYDPDSRLPVLLSARIYRGILAAVRKNGYDCFRRKQSVGQIEKASIYLMVQTNLACLDEAAATEDSGGLPRTEFGGAES